MVAVMMTNSQTDKPLQPLASLSIAQFCERYGMSKAMYFLLRDRGEGPAEVRIGARIIRITEAAAAEWEARHTHRSEAEAQAADTQPKKKPVR